jgi:ethanolamine ammonia-lyase small subunit
MKRSKSTYEPDGWTELRRLTAARIALGRAGGSLPTEPHLAFQLAHAEARDAVHAGLDVARLRAEIEASGRQTIEVASRAPDRRTYLVRPDLGRRLDDASRDRLGAWQNDSPDAAKERATSRPRIDAVLVAADGLSATAVQRTAPRLVAAVTQRLGETSGSDGVATGSGWDLGPVVIATQARVAIGDEIGALLGARLVAVMIGERPGLSAPDSLGVYLTWGPAIGRTDAERNCISNIRDGGLSVEAAADTLAWLMREARRRGLTGVALKDETALAPPGGAANEGVLGPQSGGSGKDGRTGGER